MANVEDLESALEAVLFVCTDAVTTKHLSEIFEKDEKEIEDALKSLGERYEKEDKGSQGKSVGGCVAWIEAVVILILAFVIGRRIFKRKNPHGHGGYLAYTWDAGQ